MFERNSYIGGRSTTVNAYDDPSIPVELGASIFVKVNQILNDAVEKFNLSTSDFIPESEIPGAALAVWNGEEFVVTQNSGSSWWDTAKLLWKYGLAPIKTMRLMRTVVGKFLDMYDEPVFPFESLTQAAQDVGLLAVTASTGQQYLEENAITGDFGNDIVQASTRVNYAQNLAYIHGLEAMVCMAAEDAQSVQGGNWRIFEHMIAAANATIVLNTEVSSIERSSESGQLRLNLDDVDYSSRSELRSEGYDDAILAMPFQFSDISLKSLDIEIDEVPYVELHVTLFTSPHLISPTFFNMAPDEPAPRVILTTLPSGEQPGKGPESVGSPGFFSISLLRPATNPDSGAQEYIYKIFSPSPPNSTFLSKLLGLKASHNDNMGAGINDKDITWIYRKLWHSYPYEYPRVTFEKIRLDDGVWYTSGMDSFISTMETNALMGKNVARLIVDRWQVKDGKSNAGFVTARGGNEHLI